MTWLIAYKGGGYEGADGDRKDGDCKDAEHARAQESSVDFVENVVGVHLLLAAIGASLAPGGEYGKMYQIYDNTYNYMKIYENR